MEDLIRRCNCHPPPSNKEREMNDRCACIGVDQANGRVAGSKSKAGNFLSGGECVCEGGGGGSRPSSGLPTAGVVCSCA